MPTVLAAICLSEARDFESIATPTAFCVLLVERPDALIETPARFMGFTSNSKDK